MPHLTPASSWALFGSVNTGGSGISTAFFGRSGDGYFYHLFHDAAGVRQPYFEVHSVDGTVCRYIDVGASGGLQHWVIDRVTDPYDNQTRYVYASGRLSRIKYPSGIDQCWNYAPAWIGTAANQWDPDYYSGVEVTYEDTAASPQNLSGHTQRMLFKRLRGTNGALVSGARPFAGDVLYRVYQARMPVLDDVSNTGNVLYTLPGDLIGTDRVVVTELSYYTGSTRLYRTSQFVADLVAGTISPQASQAASVVSREYAYVEVPSGSGIYRVQSEALPIQQKVTNFSYVYDALVPARVDQVTRSDVGTGTQVTETLDDFQRVTQRAITPSNNSVGRPRASDTDNGGAVEPTSIVYNYTYSACAACRGKPTRIEELPSGRVWDFTYDSLTGLLTEEKAPSPSGTGVTTTTYVWQPAVAGKLYGAYKLVSRSDASGLWNYTYVSVVRDNSAFGVKHQIVGVSSPVVTIPGGGSGGSVAEVTEFNVLPAPMSSGGDRQVALVGQLKTELDGDGVLTEYGYDSFGLLQNVVQSPQGGSASIRTDCVHDRWGRLVQVTSNSTSTLAQARTLTYNNADLLTSVSTTVNGQAQVEKFFYDRWGNLSVHLLKNVNSANSAPNDFGTPGRSEVARDWIRNESHYSLGRLVRSYADRRPLDRDATSEAVADTENARYLRTDYTWMSQGWINSITSPNGSVTQFTHDGYGSLYKVEKQGLGQTALVERMFCNSSLEVVRQIRGTGASALTTTIERNGAGVVEKVTEPSVAAPGTWYPWAPAYAVHEFDTDTLGRTIERRVFAGGSLALLARSRVLHDQLGRPYQVDVYDPPGSSSPAQTYTVLWEGAGKQKKVSGPGGRYVERSFDSLGRVSEELDCRPTNPNRVTYSYQAHSHFLEQVTQQNWDEHPSAPVNPVLRATRYVRDGLGRVAEIRTGQTTAPTAPPSSPLVHAFTYYSTGATESYVDPSGKVERYLPDALGRLTEHFLPGTQAIWNESRLKDWTGSNDLTELLQTDGRGRVTKTVYDFAGRVQAIMEPGATVQPTAAAPNQAFGKFLAYDSASRLTDLYTGDGVRVTYARDGVGRMIARSSPTPATQSPVSWYHGRDVLRRDGLGRVIWTGSYYGPNGSAGLYAQEEFEYDGLGRTLRESFNYLGALNWATVRSTFQGGDPFRTGTSYENGLAGSADNVAAQFVPDSVGRMQEVKWQTTGTLRTLATYLHEGGATRQRTTHFNTGATQKFNTDYTYDAYGRMSRIDQSFDAQAFVEFQYDAASNLLKEIYNKQGSSTQKGDRFTYDEHHRLQKAWLGSDQAHLAATNPDGGVGTYVKKLTYSLDAANNRSSVATQAGSGGSTSTATYSTQDTGEPQGASNRYDSAEGVAPTYDQRGNTTFDGNFVYVYDEQNRLTEVYILTAGAMSGLSSMTMAANSTTGSTSATTSQGQFVVSNPGALSYARERILAKATGGPDEIVRRHKEPLYARQLRETLSPLAVQRVSSPSSSPSTSSSTSSGIGEDAVQMQLLALYLYDVSDRRVLRIVIGVQTWATAWDGWQEAQEMIPGAGADLGKLVPQRQFVWGEQLDELVAYRFKDPTGGNPTWAEYSVAEGGAHCPQRLLNSAGQVVEAQEYDPYGKTSFFNGAGAAIGDASLKGNPFGWKAVRIDPETGLLYMRHRYYSAKWGRFLTQDPLGAWGDWKGLGNGMQYGASNPLTFSDAFGLQAGPLGLPSWAHNALMWGGRAFEGGLQAAVEGPGQAIVLASTAAASPLIAGGFAIAGDTEAAVGVLDLGLESGAILAASLGQAVQETVESRGANIIEGVANDLGRLVSGDPREFGRAVFSLGGMAAGGIGAWRSLGARGVSLAASEAPWQRAIREGISNASAPCPGKYTVGRYGDIRGTVPLMDAHHVGQKAVMSQWIPGYDPATAPAILVPKVGHTLRGPNGIVSRSTGPFGSARDVIARDIRELRRVYSDVPNAQLQALIQLNKHLYPSVRR